MILTQIFSKKVPKLKTINFGMSQLNSESFEGILLSNSKKMNLRNDFYSQANSWMRRVKGVVAVALTLGAISVYSTNQWQHLGWISAILLASIIALTSPQRPSLFVATFGLTFVGLCLAITSTWIDSNAFILWIKANSLNIIPFGGVIIAILLMATLLFIIAKDRKAIRRLKRDIAKTQSQFQDADYLLTILIHDLGNNILLQNAGIHQLDRMAKNFNGNSERIQKKIASLSKASHKIREHCLSIRSLKHVSSLSEDLKEFFIAKEPLNSAIDVLDEALFSKKIRIQLPSEDQLNFNIYTNKSILTHTIFTNILGNAIKFSPFGEKIKIEINEDDQQTQLSIYNSIEDCEKDCDFSKLLLGRYSSDMDSQSGLGLGLPITRLSAKNLGIKINFEVIRSQFHRDQFVVNIKIPKLQKGSVGNVLPI